MSTGVVVLARQLVNPSSPPLARALDAYHRLDLSNYLTKRIRCQAQTARATRLTDQQLTRLAERYQAGATVYELAPEFGIERRTVAVQLKRQGVPLRRQSPTTADVDQMVRLYQAGLSLEAVGERLGFVARTVQRYLGVRGIERRDTHGRSRS